jgi:anaerobic selenocysteine-containing dehydrogenase
MKLLQAACPYCGVGCGTLIKVENGKVVGMVPDKKHPTNKGIQCIKGLNAYEPIYKDRLTDVLVRKDMSDPLRGHVSATKGRFDDDVFIKMPYEEAENSSPRRSQKYAGGTRWPRRQRAATMERSDRKRADEGILVSN